MDNYTFFAFVSLKDLKATTDCENSKADFPPIEISCGGKYIITNTLKSILQFQMAREKLQLHGAVFLINSNIVNTPQNLG